MAQISKIDEMTTEEQALLSFYRIFPGATWADAADALNMDDETAIRMSANLQMTWGKVRMNWTVDGLSTFTPVETSRLQLQDHQYKLIQAA